MPFVEFLIKDLITKDVGVRFDNNYIQTISKVNEGLQAPF